VPSLDTARSHGKQQENHKTLASRQVTADYFYC
jgi:hypothetical protein